MRKHLLEFVRLALDGGHVFHGSPLEFDTLNPSETSRMNEKGKIVYDGVSAHATPLLACALNYVGQIQSQGYNHGVSLIKVPVRDIVLFGPKTKNDALRHIFAKGGYLYAFLASSFHWKRGLGASEVISLVPVVPTHVLHVSYEDVKELARFCGVEFVFDGRYNFELTQAVSR